VFDLKRLLSYLPQNNKETTHRPYELTDEIREQLETIIPDNPINLMICIIAGIIDEDSF
jgi:propionyl-CoA carboxylase beta chain